jgi:hypothetical protein
MSHSHDIHNVCVIKVDHRKRKALKHEPAGSMEILRPAQGRPRNAIQRFGDGSNKSGTGIRTALQIPIIRTFNFLPRQPVEAIRLTSSRH